MMSAPEGLKYLNGETSEDILGTFRDYARSEKEDGRIIFTRFQQMRLISLIKFVKDKTRLEEEASFPDETKRKELIYELEEATTRKK